MLTVAPTEIQSKTFCKLCNTHSFYLTIKLINDAGYTLQAELNLFTSEKCHVATAHIGHLHGNCGARELGGMWVRPYTVEFAQFWLRIVEDYVKYRGYSALVATDGSSSQWRLGSVLEAVSGWTVVPLGENQRMTAAVGRSTIHQMKLYCKHLGPFNDTFINWRHAIQAAQT